MRACMRTHDTTTHKNNESWPARFLYLLYPASWSSVTCLLIFRSLIWPSFRFSQCGDMLHRMYYQLTQYKCAFSSKMKKGNSDSDPAWNCWSYKSVWMMKHGNYWSYKSLYGKLRFRTDIIKNRRSINNFNTRRYSRTLCRIERNEN